MNDPTKPARPFLVQTLHDLASTNPKFSTDYYIASSVWRTTMTPEQRDSYEAYLAEFDPTPQYGGDEHDYPMSEDAWLEQQEN